MEYTHLSVATDKSAYEYREHVKITVQASFANRPAAKRRLRIAVFRPSGLRTFGGFFHTDNNGVAIAVFQLHRLDFPGSYSVEVHSKDGTMGLTSFLVI